MFRISLTMHISDPLSPSAQEAEHGQASSTFSGFLGRVFLLKTEAGEASAPGSFLRVKGFIFFFCVSQRGAGIPRASGRGLLTSGWAGPVQSPSPGYTEPIQDTLHPPLPYLPSFLFSFLLFFMVLGVTHTIYKGTTTEPHLTLHNLPSPWFKAPFHNLSTK